MYHIVFTIQIFIALEVLVQLLVGQRPFSPLTRRHFPFPLLRGRERLRLSPEESSHFTSHISILF